MGFNPFRPQSNTTTDVLIVASFVVITIAFVLWALSSGRSMVNPKLDPVVVTSVQPYG